jgi:hypothetical protein
VVTATYQEGIKCIKTIKAWIKGHGSHVKAKEEQRYGYPFFVKTA